MSIELKNVSFSYNGSSEGALHGVDLNISDGEFVVLIGSSGCGKTTITRTINGMIPYFYSGKMTGEVHVEGKPVGDLRSYELSRIVGSVFQNPRTQFFNTDTDSELAFGLENRGDDPDDINSRLDSITPRLNIASLRGRDIFKLSGGQKQKIAFSSIYAADPSVYILDEPSANLDEEGIEDIRSCLRLIKAEGKTIVIAEHRLYYLTDLADRYIYLADGRITREYTRDEFLKLSDRELIDMGLRASRKILLEAKAPAAPSSEDAIDIKDLTLLRSGKKICEDINVTIRRGEVLGVVGRNGAGKTTFLRTLAGLHKEYTGSIMIDGKLQKPKELTLRSYLVMQDVNYQLFADSVYNECTLGLKGIYEDDVMSALGSLDLSSYRDRHPNTLSGGQKQRLSLAVSLIMNKDICLLDEPTSGLDGQNMRRTADIIDMLRKKGKYIILVSHDTEFMNFCCDSFLTLSSCD